MSDTAILEPPKTDHRTKTRPRTTPKTKKPVPWHVVLHDDMELSKSNSPDCDMWKILWSSYCCKLKFITS